MQVSKWGNSLAIRLPAAVVEALKLKEGDSIVGCLTRGSFVHSYQLFRIVFLAHSCFHELHVLKLDQYAAHSFCVPLYSLLKRRL
jgi:hypothetical protein